MWKPGQLITVPRGTVYRVKKGTCGECDIWISSPFCTICKCELFACLKRENYVETRTTCNNQW